MSIRDSDTSFAMHADVHVMPTSGDEIFLGFWSQDRSWELCVKGLPTVLAPQCLEYLRRV